MDTIDILWFSLTQSQFLTVLTAVQLAGIFVPMISIIVILQKEQSRGATYLMLANAACCIINCAYLMILEMENQEAITTSYRLEYVGISFFFFFFILFMMEYQHMRFSNIVSVVWPLFEIIEIPQMWIHSAVSTATSEETTEKVTEIASAASQAASQVADGDSNLSNAASQVADAANQVANAAGSGSAADAAGNAASTFGDFGQKWMGDVSVSLDEKLGMYRVNMDGALYRIRFGIIAGMLFILLVYTLIRFVRMKNKTERHNLIHLMIAQGFLLAILTISQVAELSFDIIPIACSVVVCAMTLSVMVGEFFTVTDQGRNWVFEHTSDLFLIADDNYGYLDANRYAKKLFPELRFYHKNQIMSERILELFKNKTEDVEIDGHFYRQSLATLYQNEKKKKKVAGYSLILTDITDQLRLVDEANAANEAKSAFLSNMSHEIRTPMNAIVGMTEIMLREDLNSQQKEYLSNIKVSGDALLGIINDILDFSKIESGKMELIEDDYTVLSTFHDLKVMFTTIIGARDIDLIFDIDKKMPAMLHGDAKRVRQIIINLVNNAIKFTEKGSITLRVSVAEKMDDQVRLEVAVTDTGSGIKEEDLNKLFQSFSQVDSHKNHSKEGTGLGLAICKQLVTMMGGKIGVTSTYGEGSTFYFDIIQTIASDQIIGETSIDSYVSEDSTTLNFTAPDAHILIVDDNAMNLKVANGLLEPLHMQIDTAENGKEALDKIETNDYDIVFMDHMMPVMDGVEATKILRSREEAGTHQIVIALTADAVAGAKESFLAAGMDDFVAKPIEIKDICGKLKTYLPDDKILLLDEDELSKLESEESEEIPVILGLDVEAGIRYSGSQKLFISLLGDYYKLIDTKTKKISQCLSDGMIRDLTIEVHALKNTSRMIGALKLSDMFKELEDLGNAEDLKALEEKVPKVLELYQSYKPILKPYGTVDDALRKDVSLEYIKGLLETMSQAMDGFDLDGVDAAMKELEDCRLPESISDDMDALRAAVADVAMEEVMRLCQVMMDAI